MDELSRRGARDSCSAQAFTFLLPRAAEDANPCKSDRLPTLSMSPPAPGGEHGNFEDWSTTEVMQWLERISMAHLVECFVSSHITGKVLSLMTKDELYGMMEGHPLGDKILL